MSGCAKRNADRELALVLDLLDEHIRAHQQSADDALDEHIRSRLRAARASLELLRDDLERKAHRERP